MTTLGICIPTYKRPDFLRRCVISAFEAAGDYPIHVFIADDSTDDTNSDLYQELQSKYPRISVHRNQKNLGIDNNIQCCVDICDCDYAWIVGEDDYFLPNSIHRVFDLLQGMSLPFLFSNYAYVGIDDVKIGQALSRPSGCMPAVKFIGEHLWAAGFIGACIINRKLWSSTPAEPYANTYYTHVGRICELMALTHDPIYVIAEPSVGNRVEGEDNFTWKHDSYGVFFGFKAMCETVAERHSIFSQAAFQAISGMEKRYGWMTLRLAMRLRSELGYDFRQYQRYLASNIKNPLRRLLFYVISISPPPIFRPLVIIYRRLRNFRLLNTR